MNHDETVKFRITRAIATCKHIPLDRDKRAGKVAGYVEDEIQRQKHPEQVARTIKDLQEQVQSLLAEVHEQRRYANEGRLGRIRRKL